MNAVVTTGANALIPTSMEGAMRLAEMMARGKLVPQHLHNQPGDCLMVIEQATRWGMSPFAVAQSTSVIQGKLMFEGKLVSAAIHASGILSSRLAYEFSGSGDTRAVTVSGTIKGEAEARTITVTLKEAKTSNGMWTKQPDQQLVYFGNRAWARRHVPEIMLGVYSPEEMEVPAQRDNFSGTTIEAQPYDTSREAARAIGDEIPARVMDAPAPKKQTISEWLDALDADLHAAADSEAVDAIIARQDVQTAMDRLKNGARDRLNDMINAAIQRTAPAADEDVFPGDLPSSEAA